VPDASAARLLTRARPTGAYPVALGTREARFSDHAFGTWLLLPSGPSVFGFGSYAIRAIGFQAF
jgi:hypothetical protein